MLAVDKMSVHYGAVQALSRVSLTVDAGETVSIIGSNGSGKSSLLKAVSGVIPPSAGRCLFMGERIDAMPSHRIVQLGIAHVPQGGELFPNMTVLENLGLGALGGGNSRQSKSKLEEIFADFPILAEKRKQKAGTLSGGQQQIVAIARALMSEPRLLLLDEPSAGLAPILVQRLREVIARLQQKGLPMLLVEQNAFLALEVSKRTYVLESGSIVTSAPSAELIDSDIVRDAYLGI